MLRSSSLFLFLLPFILAVATASKFSSPHLKRKKNNTNVCTQAQDAENEQNVMEHVTTEITMQRPDISKNIVKPTSKDRTKTMNKKHVIFFGLPQSFERSSFQRGNVKSMISSTRNNIRRQDLSTALLHNDTINPKILEKTNQNVSLNLDKNLKHSVTDTLKSTRRKITEELVSVMKSLQSPNKHRLNISNELPFQGSRLLSTIMKNQVLKHIKFHGFNRRSLSWPWQVSVEEESSSGWRHMCHGALIHNKVVLIPTYCIKHKQLPALRIVNSHKDDYFQVISSLDNEDGTYQAQEIENAIRLTNIGSGKEKSLLHPTKHHGVSLLYLNRNMGVRPVSWYSKNNHYPKSHCFAEYDIPIRFIPTKACRKYYKNKGSLTKFHFCASGQPCTKKIHLGSPLVCYRHGGQPLLIGISAQRHSCKHHSPRIFEGISPYHIWISAHLTLNTN